LGKMHEFKGVTELLKAASLLKDKDFILLFIPESKPDKRYVEKYVKKYGLEEKTLFLEYQPPWLIPSIYKASTCLVCAEHDHPVSSHRPLAAIEAVHAGTCVIIIEETHKKMHFSSFERNRDVVVVDPKNTEDFSGKLKKLIENPEMARNTGEESGKMQFTENPERLIEIYRELTRG
ncbi:MAG: glycosyltransferase, partial [Candidatus Aenigmatarchaeota archaeon]